MAHVSENVSMLQNCPPSSVRINLWLKLISVLPKLCMHKIHFLAFEGHIHGDLRGLEHTVDLANERPYIGDLGIAFAMVHCTYCMADCVACHGVTYGPKHQKIFPTHLKQPPSWTGCEEFGSNMAWETMPQTGNLRGQRAFPNS
jgi:hypothetical protein